jgi:hypothetical protein
MTYLKDFISKTKQTIQNVIKTITDLVKVGK